MAMTNLKQNIKEKQPKHRFSDLTAKLQPISVTEIYETVTANLNASGKKTRRQQRYNYNIVTNVFYGKYEDYNNQIERELQLMVAAKEGIANEVQAHMDAIDELLASVAA